ncbi:hypothetical protein B0H14DRAFT_2612999 [Mycena olivaceomarginata]|nr:hypothetical protein B0H14DRAFT_2612999 [Mycena olivaceomarginata]
MAVDSFAAPPGHTTLSCRLQRDPLSIYEFQTDLPTSPQSQTLGGCGAQVHMRASSAVRHWYGDEDTISPTVVPLETRYFSQEQRAALTRGRRCGCRLEGVGALCKPEEAERAAILPASTAHSSRPNRARVVGDYAMTTPHWSGWEGDELSENMDDLFWSIPSFFGFSCKTDLGRRRQYSSGFRDNDAAVDENDRERARQVESSQWTDFGPSLALLGLSKHVPVTIFAEVEAQRQLGRSTQRQPETSAEKY